MSFNDPQLASILVLVMGAFVLLETLFVIVALHQIQRRLRKAEAAVDTLLDRTFRTLQSSRTRLEQLEKIGEKFPELQDKMEGFLEDFLQAAHWADEAAEKQVRRLRLQLEASNKRCGIWLSQFSRQTYRVQKAIRDPARQVSAVIRGVLAGIRCYFSNGRSKPETAPLPDREIFI